MDICAFLNITETRKTDTNNLTGKFAVLDSSKDLSIFEWLFSSMIHQLIVAKCTYHIKVAFVASDFYRDTELIKYETMGYFSPDITWILLPNVFVPISIMLNISLILITITKLKDHKVCNWLIAYDSLCQMFVVTPFGVNLVGVIFRYSPIDYRICLASLMASTVASYASMMAIYLISVERLLIIMFPIKMNWKNKATVRRWTFIGVIICTIFGLVMNLNVFNVWTIINLNYSRWLYCNTGLYSDILSTWTSYLVLFLCSINYAVIFGMIWWRHFQQTSKGKNRITSTSNKSVDQSMRKMLRSVFLLLFVILLGWLITSAARNKITDFLFYITSLIVNCFMTDPVAQKRMIANITSVLIGIITCVPIWASASGAPILLLNSNDYREAYKKALMCRIKNTPAAAVAPLFISNKIVVVNSMNASKYL